MHVIHSPADCCDSCNFFVLYSKVLFNNVHKNIHNQFQSYEVNQSNECMI